MLIPVLLLIELLIFSLLRVIFYWWNAAAFAAVPSADLYSAFLVGLRVDIVTVFLLAIPAVLLWCLFAFFPRPPSWARTVTALLFLLLQIPAVILSLGDCEFVKFTGHRFTHESLFFLQEGNGKWWSMFLVYAHLLAAAIATVTLNIVAVSVASRKLLLKTRWWVYLPSVILIFVGARGGWQKKPLSFSQAQIFQVSMLNHLTLNSGFSVIKSYGRASLPQDKFFSEKDDQWLRLLPGSGPGTSAMDGKRWWQNSGEKQNVVVIVVESLSLEFLGLPFGDKGYTPFVDTLASRGVFFRHNIANGRRSMEGVGAVLTGIPTLMNEAFISSSFTSNEFLRIGSVLNQQGYHTSFFHGGYNGTMFFDTFTKAIGISRYFGASEYHNANDDDHQWGIYDGPFLQRMKAELDHEALPFFSTVFTLTSHNPFHLPAEAQGKFPKGDVDVDESIGYMDDSLRRFFAEAEKSPWYQNTLFVITADHTFSGGSRPEFRSEVGQYRTPLIFFHPHWELHPELKPIVDGNQITNQIDIMASVLDFLGLPQEKTNLLTRSVFRAGPRWAVVYENDKYHLITEDHSVSHRQGSAEFFQIEAKDLEETHPILLKDENIEVQRLKAYIQYFADGMLENKIERKWSSPP